MGAIKGIFDAVTSGVRNAVEGVGKMVQSGLKLDFKGVADGLTEAIGLNSGDQQIASASRAGNTLMQRELAMLMARYGQGADASGRLRG
ncbi:hypothetical protein GN316_14240 [Xylophilus sp. Kf1]|nr:hypothetical protein [Xylophilus sp. Kf1]